MEQKLNLKDVLDEIKVDLVKEHYTHFDLEVIDEIKQKMYKVNYNLADFYNLIHDLSYKDLFDAEYLKTQKFIMSNIFILDKVYIRYKNIIEDSGSFLYLARIYPINESYPRYVNCLARLICEDIKDRVDRKRQEFFLKNIF